MREAAAVKGHPLNSGAKSRSAVMSSAPKKNTILVVEDEEIVRKLLCDVLEGDGYRVFVCSSPDEGIEIGQRHAEEIDLLLTDVVMPGMNGREMARRIHEFLPQLPVLFMSGYAKHSLPEQEQVNSNFEYLQKPFTLRSLSEKLRAILEKRQA